MSSHCIHARAPIICTCTYTCFLRTTKRVYTLQSTHTYPLVLPIYIQPNLLPFQTSTSWLTLHTPIHDHTAQSTTTHMCSHFTHSHVLTLHTPIRDHTAQCTTTHMCSHSTHPHVLTLYMYNHPHVHTQF